MIMSFNSNRTGATEGLGTAYPSGAHEFTLGFLGVHIAQSLVLYVVFVNHFLFFLSFDLRLLIIPLVVSNNSSV
jgi:hypothetical protein